jgi:hypothetical protein
MRTSRVFHRHDKGLPSQVFNRGNAIAQIAFPLARGSGEADAAEASLQLSRRHVLLELGDHAMNVKRVYRRRAGGPAQEA